MANKEVRQPEKSIESWNVPRDVSDLDMAFPARVVGTFLPTKEEIPKDFWRGKTEWNRAISKLFFQGGILPKVKQGIDSTKARRHLQTLLGSYEPEHEHKEAGAAWLMSLWYESPNL